MKIDSLHLENFRNYERLELDLDPGTNVFYGKNAQGKTNILESVCLCGTTKSHRQARDRDMIRFGEEEAHIRMMITKGEIPYRIDMHLKKSRAKGIAINASPIRKAGDLIGLCSFVFFSPEDLQMIKNGPAERRRFLDMQLCQMSRSYVQNLSGYNRVLMQRGKLLRDLPFHPEYLHTLDIWDEQLVSYGIRVIRERAGFIKDLDERVGSIHEDLTGGEEHLAISYEANTDEGRFLSELRENREKDLKMKMTSCGPHRDDLSFKTQKIDIRRFGSQGQQRTTALSLKLAEIELVKQKMGDYPVLLLDDVLSELDSDRQKYLLEKISRVQTLVTCTGMDDFRDNRFRIDRMFSVEDGTVHIISSDTTKAE